MTAPTMTRRLWRRPLAWCAAAGCLAILGVGTVVRARAAASHTVAMEAMQFQPAMLVVKVGDVITWVNKDLVPHTATSRSGVFDSGTIEPGHSFSYTATRAGEFPYACVWHPTMVALLRVK